ncbi:hypothetical protein ABFS82_07G021800 [Erythranthe guttata]|uniref:putative F-box protein At5g40050 n=1 Tax=Erythranthe guttata TaxID=4155 RepID=UPI00064DD9F5|nr:PREDICTED: putative F-box protein At5g40050 [Erythranthe guttata]|eukprot:XP_012827888.1 PREDICTED: putative F-box protein At5g40050 [Erythranthe guttata]
MEKGKRIQVMEAAEIPLPEPIIHRIQSYLSEKQSAQTSILSKSWYSAWLTRPDLALDERNFAAAAAHSFSDHAAKTMDRYEKSNLKIENFKLWLHIGNRDRRSLANELIRRALKIGVFNLSLKLRLPDSIILTSTLETRFENTVRLSVTGGRADCPRHKPLKLIGEFTVDDLVNEDVITLFPSIEKLWSYECGCSAAVRKATHVRVLESKIQRRGFSLFHY